VPARLMRLALKADKIDEEDDEPLAA
jgi:hypothetical protein